MGITVLFNGYQRLTKRRGAVSPFQNSVPHGGTATWKMGWKIWKTLELFTSCGLRILLVKLQGTWKHNIHGQITLTVEEIELNLLAMRQIRWVTLLPSHPLHPYSDISNIYKNKRLFVSRPGRSPRVTPLKRSNCKTMCRMSLSSNDRKTQCLCKSSNQSHTYETVIFIFISGRN